MSRGRICAIVFDMFGTLARIGAPRHPYRQMLQWGRDAGLALPNNPAAFILTKPGGLRATAQRLGWAPPEVLMRRWEADLDAELDSIQLLDGVADTLSRLRDRGWRIGVCSDLAEPYEKPLLSLLPFTPRPRVWSFDAGAIKPDPQIYATLCQSFALEAHEILFIGDSWQNDVEGPRKFGMWAWPINASDKARLPVCDLF